MGDRCLCAGFPFFPPLLADEQKGSSALDSAGVVMGLTELAASNLSETPVVVGVLRVLQSLHGLYFFFRFRSLYLTMGGFDLQVTLPIS